MCLLVFTLCQIATFIVDEEGAEEGRKGGGIGVEKREWRKGRVEEEE